MDAGLTACPASPRSGGYSPHGAYARSKLALVLFSHRLQALLEAKGSPVTANVADPGVVNTDLYRHVFWGTRLLKKLFGWWFFKVRPRRRACRFGSWDLWLRGGDLWPRVRGVRAGAVGRGGLALLVLGFPGAGHPTGLGTWGPLAKGRDAETE